MVFEKTDSNVLIGPTNLVVSLNIDSIFINLIPLNK